MAVKEESRVRCEEISYKQYTTSDGKVFLSKSEAEVHDGLLKWSDTVRNFGVKNTGGAYHCMTEEEFNAVVNMIAYENYAYNYNERKFTPINYYEKYKFSGDDWYFFFHETNMDYPDEYWMETLSQKKQEFADWLKQFEESA